MPALRQIVYETGPTGYGLARHLHNENLPVSVAPTSRIPRVVGSSDKTDKLDSKQLAQYAAKGLLQSVTIPSLKQEADRQARVRVCKAGEEYRASVSRRRGEEGAEEFEERFRCPATLAFFIEKFTCISVGDIAAKYRSDGDPDPA